MKNNNIFHSILKISSSGPSDNQLILIQIKASIHSWHLKIVHFQSAGIWIINVQLLIQLCPICNNAIESKEHLSIEYVNSRDLGGLAQKWWGFNDYLKIGLRFNLLG